MWPHYSDNAAAGYTAAATQPSSQRDDDARAGGVSAGERLLLYVPAAQRAEQVCRIRRLP